MSLALMIPQDNAPQDDEARWRIALAKDRRFDGTFVTGVHSTGIYCRPSCPARPPKRENVSFYATPGDAEAAGLRPCLRCRPDDVSRDEAAVAQAIRMLRDAEEIVPLERLAAATGYSPATGRPRRRCAERGRAGDRRGLRGRLRRAIALL